MIPLVGPSFSMPRDCDGGSDHCKNMAPEEKKIFVWSELLYWIHDNQINEAVLILTRY